MQIQKLENTCSMVHLWDMRTYDFDGDWRNRFKILGINKTAMFVTNWNWRQRLKYLPFAVKKVHSYLGNGAGDAYVMVVDVRTPMERLKIWLDRR